MIVIPVTNYTKQSFRMIVDDTVYGFKFLYETRSESWGMTISVGDTNIATGVPLIIGTNIIQQYPKLKISGIYVVNIENSTVDPTVDNLGTETKVVILSESERSSVYPV